MRSRYNGKLENGTAVWTDEEQFLLENEIMMFVT